MAKKDWHHLYNTAQWKALRANWLVANPICVMCWQLNKTTPAKVVDHIIPHKGDIELFFNEENLQSLCPVCHDVSKSRQENRGYLQGCDPSGMPLNKDHHWNSRGKHGYH